MYLYDTFTTVTDDDHQVTDGECCYFPTDEGWG